MLHIAIKDWRKSWQNINSSGVLKYEFLFGNFMFNMYIQRDWSRKKYKIFFKKASVSYTCIYFNERVSYSCYAVKLCIHNLKKPFRCV